VSRDPQPRALVFVLPGGGYEIHADHEAEPVAVWLESIGIAARVLRYPVAPAHHPEALDYVRDYVAQARADFDGPIGVLGFSAGGHLAGLAAYLPAAAAESVPDFAILCYPVTSMGEGGHLVSRLNLLGPDFVDPEQLSLAGLVGPSSPPTFLWHTADDEAVLVLDSIELAASLARAHRDFALYVFPEGVHGLGLARGSSAAEWTSLCASWLNRLLGS